MNAEQDWKDVEDYSVTYLIGSRADGTDTPESDTNLLSIYHHPEDNKRVFKHYYNEWQITEPGKTRRITSLENFVKGLAAGLESMEADVIMGDELEKGRLSAFVLFVLKSISGKHANKNSYLSVESKIKENLTSLKHRLDTDPSFYKDTPQDALKYQKMLSLDYLELVKTIRRYTSEKPSQEEIEVARGIKFGSTPFLPAMQLVEDKLTMLESICSNPELPSPSTFMELVNDLFLDEGVPYANETHSIDPSTKPPVSVES